MSAIPLSPGVEIQQRFAIATGSATPRLAPCIVGPQAFLARYSEEIERPDTRLGTYDPVGSLLSSGDMGQFFPWENKPAGSMIDNDYVQLHIENAMLRYFSKTDNGVLVAARNRLQHPNLVFGTNGSATMSASLGDRGPRVGDTVVVRGTHETANDVELVTRIQAITGDLLNPVIGTPVKASTNPSTQVAGNTVTELVNVSENELTAAGTYDGLDLGKISETYTITVITASTSALSAARVNIISASGTDNQYNVPAGSAIETATPVGTRGVTMEFAANQLNVGDSFRIVANAAYAAPSLVAGSAYTGKVDRTYIVEVVVGGDYGTAKVRVSTQAGDDSSGPTTILVGSGATSAAFPIGSNSLTGTFSATNGLRKGEVFTIQVQSAKVGTLDTLVLAHNLPPIVDLGDELDACHLQFFVRRNLTLDRKSLSSPGEYIFTSTNTELTVLAGIHAMEPTWTVSGEAVPIPIIADPLLPGTNTLFATFRAWYTPSTSLQSISANNSIDDAMPGPGGPDNPLKYGVTKAQLNAGGNTVFYVNTGNPNSLVNWQNAFALLDKSRSPYGVAVLSDDTDVLDLGSAHVESRSSSTRKMYRTFLTGSTSHRQSVIVSADTTSDEAVALATLTDNPDSIATDYTLLTVTSENVDFEELGVRPLDKLRFFFEADAWGDETYQTFVVDSVLGADRLLLASGPDAPQVIPVRFEIVRDNKAADIIASVTRVKSRFATRRSRFIGFSRFTDGDYAVPGYFVAAAVAGLRAFAAPNQSLTNLGISGFDGVEDLELFDYDQLNQLAAAGVMIIDRDIATNRLFIRHAVTCADFSNELEREEMYTAITDTVSLYLDGLFRPYIGQANAVESMVAIIRSRLIAAQAVLIDTDRTEERGGLIVGFENIDVRRSVIFKDTITVSLDLLVPGPLNRLSISLLVQ